MNVGKSIRSPIHAVACPHCGKGNDFRVLESQQLLDTGHQVFCDYCSRSMVVTQIATVKTVAVARDPSGKVRPQAGGRQLPQGQRQLPQKRPGFFQKLLGKG